MKKNAYIVFSLILVLTLNGCGVYNFTGGNVGTATTFTIPTFQNYATQNMVLLLNLWSRKRFYVSAARPYFKPDNS
ncbi:hypothetical protein [Zobellia laminariae]|uniref:hypothetical protein n=1 Tax=Zobellia laminariae TaxID=248906 RepID=UPI0026F439B4|nr:hypothetical protein [Zobellia laminariae]WKX77526.1 hypothetical protein Q5W13_05660 [Zobellia laminariae]